MKAPTRDLGVLVLASLLLGGCATKTYPNRLPQNLRVETRTDSGFFSSVRAAVDIHSVDSECRTEYLGTMRLSGPSLGLGLAVDRPSFLVFSFASSSWLSSSSSTISYETLLTPRSGHEYDVDVSYVDDLYEVSVAERDPRSGRRREVERRDLEACSTSGWF